jgi:hypothetical protein
MKNFLIFVLLVTVIWFGNVIVRLENYHYANSIGICAEHLDLVQRSRCLNASETRTSPFWHLAHALVVI